VGYRLSYTVAVLTALLVAPDATAGTVIVTLFPASQVPVRSQRREVVVRMLQTVGMQAHRYGKKTGWRSSGSRNAGAQQGYG
jgi:hypothetical protein